jgi:predicted negative regulator of RcsB-dependent stress response
MNNWLKILICVMLLVIGGFAGYFYHAYQYKTLLEEGRNYQAKQSLDAAVYGDITKNVQIVCNFGSKKTISGQDSGLIFAANNFDANGNFTDYDKNSAIQSVCGISAAEVSSLIGKTTTDGNYPKLFNVILNK